MARLRLWQGRDRWMIDDCFRNPGPVQYQGQCADLYNISLGIEQEERQRRMKEIEESIAAITRVCNFQCSDQLLESAAVGLGSLSQIIALMQTHM